MLYYAGLALEVLSVASFAAALVLLFVRLIRKDELPTLADREQWFSRGNLRILLWAAAAALGSRLLLAGLAYLAYFLARAFGGAAVNDLLQRMFGSHPPSLEALFSHWDAPHYLDIARYGYTSDLTVNGGEQHWFIVFYPFYPALIALLSPVLGGQFNAATAISWASLAGACYWIYRLTLLDAEKKEAVRAVKYLLVFPMAVFLGAPYTESLFLLLTALCFWALRKRSFWLAGLLGFAAALTRNLGALLAFPYLVELLDSLGFFSRRGEWKTGRFWLGFVRDGVWALLIPLGVGVYLYINQVAYGDPFTFLAIQNSHWYNHTQPFWETVLTTFKALTYAKAGEKALLWGPQLAGMVAMLAAMPFLMKKLRPSYAAYLLVYVLIALSPSNLLSFNRYMMGCVPLFLGLPELTKGRKWADVVLTVVFVLLMLYLGAGFLMWGQVV